MIRTVFAAAFAVLAGPALAAVEVQEVTSPGGIDAWLVEEHSIPFTALEIRFVPGAAADRDGKRGAVNLMAGLLEEGTGDLDAQGFAAARDELAARFGYDAHDDAVSVSAQFLTENRDEAVDLLRRSIVEPAFPEDAIARVKDQVLSIIARDATDPGAIARETFDRLAFGDHPYGSPVEGTAESVTALTRDDIEQAHRDTLVKDHLYVSAVGDITPEELGTLLDDLLGDLPQSSDAPLPADAGWNLEPGVEVVDYPVPQSVILFGHEGIERDDPDFFPAYVANQIFGGAGFESRLMDEVRVQRGLTYGIGTYLAPMEYAEVVGGQANSANATAAELVDVVRGQWGRIAEGVTEEELADTKTYLTGAYPLRFDGNANIASILVGMQMDELEPEYIDTRNDLIEAVTLDDITRVAERIYRPDDLSFVIVGQPEGIDAD
ncbi:zinc protease [Palleronia marisminoris]|uniref:Peptidase M16 inactive domain protein n=1 Tax=Palleronia marisminoris TaxID=315423 RepID=A0A1Y5SJR8_9RHOB|nr:pitrilysin family protein [Palleronia marisminoris]SFG85481.1 zinc protease [Palleronia marisminoris]SLN42453.1 Peptidase M16 inactive domain protein [Palleronia marisminoris]